MRVKGGITDSELRVMKVLWYSNDFMSTNEIVNRLQGETEWDRSTIRTLIKRLVEKGAVIQEKQGTLCYKAAITETDFTDEQTRSLIDKLYKGSAKNLMAALIEHDNLTKDDIDELKKILAQF